MDALSDVLRVMRLKGGVFLHGDFVAPWCLSVKVRPQSCSPYLGQTAHIIPYHFVLEGRMRVRMPDGLEFEMQPGESVMFPQNDTHLMGSDLTRPPVRSWDVVERPAGGGLNRITLGSGAAPTRIICGFLGSEQVDGNPVVRALPTALRLDARADSAGDWIRTTFHHAAEQIAAGRMGSEVVMSRLSELLFVEAIQRYTETLAGEATGWLAGLRDPFVSRAMALLHARVDQAWTVDALGREVGLSRSALADRFVEVLGVPPMQYLANWRIHVAAYELINSKKPIAEIAAEVGYESEASFTRAFKRVMAAPPATWRRQRGAAAAV
jgi:AraC family transcriptional regulator, alkane utilization regulator